MEILADFLNSLNIENDYNFRGILGGSICIPQYNSHQQLFYNLLHTTLLFKLVVFVAIVVVLILLVNL